MSCRIFQGVVVQMKDATDRAIGVVDADGVVVASSELSLIGSQINDFEAIAHMLQEGMAIADNKTFKIISGTDTGLDYTVFVDGTDEYAKSLCVMAYISVLEAKMYYEEKHDKSALVKNIITENILPGDIYVHAKELRLSADTSRAVFLVRQIEKADVATAELLQKLFPERRKDFVISLSETDVALVKEVPENAEAKDLYKIAQNIEKSISNELGIKTVIGVGTTAKHLRELPNKYKEAQVAIDVGKVFDTEKTIINYENLGIGRLIYQLPTTLCEMFLSEVFKKNPIESLDDETLGIITKFFENNLNISETSRKLFVHRNTLVYRLGKIKKLTGLDLRKFDQAIVFKVALMVKKYLNSQKA